MGQVFTIVLTLLHISTRTFDKIMYVFVYFTLRKAPLKSLDASSPRDKLNILILICFTLPGWNKYAWSLPGSWGLNSAYPCSSSPHRLLALPVNCHLILYHWTVAFCIAPLVKLVDRSNGCNRTNKGYNHSLS